MNAFRAYRQFDMHCHVKNDLMDVLNRRSEFGISDAVVFIPPEISQIPEAHRNHYCYISEMPSGRMGLFCGECKCFLTESEDFFFNDNLALSEKCAGIEGAHFFALIPVVKTKMQELVDKYVSAIPNLMGFKLYTGISEVTLDESIPFKGQFPLVIHTGTFENQLPNNMLHFVSSYKGNVMLAHLARLDTDFLSRVNKFDHIYYDISPSAEMLRRHLNNYKVFLYKRSVDVASVDCMYKILFDNVRLESVLWGSDEPYSELNEEYEVFQNSYLSSSEKKKILLENPLHFLRL